MPISLSKRTSAIVLAMLDAPGSSTSRSKFAAFCIARSRGNLHHIQLRNFNAVAEAFDETRAAHICLRVEYRGK